MLQQMLDAGHGEFVVEPAWVHKGAWEYGSCIVTINGTRWELEYSSPLWTSKVPVGTCATVIDIKGNPVNLNNTDELENRVHAVRKLKKMAK
jgi:hypothetical protein